MHFEKRVSFLKPKGNKYTTLIDIKSNDLLYFNQQVSNELRINAFYMKMEILDFVFVNECLEKKYWNVFLG